MTPDGVQYMEKTEKFNEFGLGFIDTSKLEPGELTFDPPVTYYANPQHMAQGGCPHTLPTSVMFKNRKQFPSAWKDPQTARFTTLHWYGTLLARVCWVCSIFTGFPFARLN
jgi:hypothetical protein